MKGKSTNQGIYNPFKRQESGVDVSNKNDQGFFSYLNKNDETDYKNKKWVKNIYNQP